MRKEDVRAKKHLGQHFLHDENIARKIVGSLNDSFTGNILEIGPGTGILTKFLLENPNVNYLGVDIDTQSIEYLKQHFNGVQFISGDFLKLDLNNLFEGAPFSIIGNFPYNISSQILFHIIKFQQQVPELIGMFQKELAERIAEGPGTKKYGSISVILQAYYEIEYLFTVSENVFTPPPKVKSGVIRLKRNSKFSEDDDQSLFKQIVKSAFNQRRKTLNNSLKPFPTRSKLGNEILGKRPEQISVEEFIEFSRILR